jgi:hypothetical protein
VLKRQNKNLTGVAGPPTKLLRSAKVKEYGYMDTQ